MDSSKVISILKQNGWYLASIRGDHHNFKKDGARYIATVPHPTKDLSKGVLASLRQVTGLEFR